MSNDWEVTVVTGSNILKTVRVDNCITRADAEDAALGMTGGQRVVVSNPKTYSWYEDDDKVESSNNSSSSGGGEGLGYAVIGGLFLIYIFWKIILVVGCSVLAFWLVYKLLTRDNY
jgi:hypothetical protein